MLPLGISIGIMIHRGRAALRSALDDARAVAEARPEEDVGVREEALLERDDDELCAAEPRAEEGADVLRVRQVQRRVDLVEDVHRCWLELQQRHDQRQRDQRPEFFFFFLLCSTYAYAYAYACVWIKADTCMLDTGEQGKD